MEQKLDGSKIEYNLPMQAYLDHPAIGSSQLKQILLTPADYKAAKERDSTETRATVLGTAVHAAILEPEKFERDYALQPEDWGDKRGGDGRKKWDAFKAENDGKIIVSYEDATFLRKVQNACAGHRDLKKLLKSGHPEVTAFTTLSDIPSKARVDLLFSDIDSTIWDVKTTSESIDDDALFKTIFYCGYHFQAAHHMAVFTAAGLPIEQYGWIFVSTKTPAVHIRLVRAPGDLIKWAKNDHNYALNLLAQCLDRDEWPGYPQQISEIQIPDWARRIYD